jgi:magnesium chelatase subunit I
LRNNPEINNERGVSVRSTIHSLEIILGEVEVTRSILNRVPTVPRFSDIYCMFQSSKFELDEIEDTTENKIMFLNNTINEIVKETSREYFAKFVSSEEISDIKKEFKNKTFTVSQNQYQKKQQQRQKLGYSTPLTLPKSKTSDKDLISSNNNDNSNTGNMLYSEQLNQFPATKKIIKMAVEKIKDEQTEYIRKAQNINISTNLEYLDYNNETIGDFDRQEETIATVIELFLECLRFSDPPILDRKENKFEYMEI